MRLIGITGRAGAGKDTVGEILCDWSGFTRIAFADPIKRMVEQLGINPHNRDTKEQPVDWLGRSPRYIMQTLGTEWGRGMIHPDIWLRVVERAIQNSTQDIVITDVRFDNEAQLIHKHGGRVWCISRPDIAAVNAHASESGVSEDLIDKHIVNDSSIGVLASVVRHELRGWVFPK